MYQPLIKFHPYPAIITQVLRIFAKGEFACGRVTCRKTMFCWRPDVFSPDIRSCRYRLAPESRSFPTFAGRKNKTDNKTL